MMLETKARKPRSLLLRNFLAAPALPATHARRRSLGPGCRLVLLAVVALLLISSSVSLAAVEDYIVRTFEYEGKTVVQMVVPGCPPELRQSEPPVVLPAAVGPDQAVNVLTNVPALDWCYGCSPTSAAMMFGYYDNLAGLGNMYAGPTNGGVFPMTNASWGYGECPLSATHMSYDGRTTRGNVDDYWVAFGDPGPDPFIVNGWVEHIHADCTADFMGTNQSNFNASDGTTYFFYNDDGSPFYDPPDSEGYRDGGHGMQLFAESRGYSVVENFSQYILNSVRGNTEQGFTFEDFQAEIDAGRPVLIHLEGHSMVGLGYDTDTGDMYIHDTWDHNDHTMPWGGIYSDMQHYAVNVIRLGHLRVTDGPEGDPNPVTGEGQVQCSVSAVDDLSHSLTYRWSATDDAGSFDTPGAPTTIWTSPENTTDSTIEYRISVTVTCSEGASVTASYIQLVEPTRPVIEITNPLNNSAIFSTTPVIQAFITDPDSGVDESSIVLTIDTDVYTLGDFTYDADSGFLRYEASLGEGAHQVTVRAKNNDGDEAEKTIYFRILQKSFDAGLHLFSLPYTYNPGQFPTPSSLFGLDPDEVATTRWWPQDSSSNKYRVYDPENGSYDTYGTFNPPDAQGGSAIVDSPPAGLGYFIRLKTTAGGTIEDTGIALDGLTSSYEIDLGYGTNRPRGWNMIGCPFTNAVNFGSAQFITEGNYQSFFEAIEEGVTDGILWGFTSTGDSGYYDFPASPAGASLEPFKGYWLHVWEDTTVVIFAGQLGGAAAEHPEVGTISSEDGWQAQIIASAGGHTDQANYIGISSRATAGYDPGLDVVEPPAVDDVIQCYQPRSDWEQYSAHYARDIRPAAAGSQTWDIEVFCGLSNVPVTLTWPRLNAEVPTEIKLMLEDLDSGQQVFMRTAGGYTFSSPEGGAVRHLRIVAYDDTATSLTLSGISAQALSDSGGVVITYSVSKPATVGAEICNISGVVIQRLSERTSSGGQVEMMLWDGRSQRGSKVPAGRYLARITAEAADGQTVQAVRPFTILP